MYQYFTIHAQKIGTKSITGKPWSLTAHENGIVCRGRFEGIDIKEATSKLVNELQESGVYCRIIVKEHYGERHENHKKIYDWRMDTEQAEVQKMGYAEYKRKRSELKAQIKALEAQIKELENEWYNGL